MIFLEIGDRKDHSVLGTPARRGSEPILFTLLRGHIHIIKVLQKLSVLRVEIYVLLKAPVAWKT